MAVIDADVSTESGHAQNKIATSVGVLKVIDVWVLMGAMRAYARTVNGNALNMNARHLSVKTIASVLTRMAVIYAFAKMEAGYVVNVPVTMLCVWRANAIQWMGDVRSACAATIAGRATTIAFAITTKAARAATKALRRMGRHASAMKMEDLSVAVRLSDPMHQIVCAMPLVDGTASHRPPWAPIVNPMTNAMQAAVLRRSAPRKKISDVCRPRHGCVSDN